MSCKGGKLRNDVGGREYSRESVRLDAPTRSTKEWDKRERVKVR